MGDETGPFREFAGKRVPAARLLHANLDLQPAATLAEGPGTSEEPIGEKKGRADAHEIAR